LKASEAHFRSMYEDAPVPYQFLMRRRAILDVKCRLVRMTGYDRNDVIGHSITEFMPPATFRCCTRNSRSLSQPAPCTELNGALLHKDGRAAYRCCRWANQPGGLRRTVKAHCVLHNITERKRPSRQWRTSPSAPERHHSGTDDAVFAKDKSGRYLLFNEAAGPEMTGKDALGGSQVTDG